MDQIEVEWFCFEDYDDRSALERVRWDWVLYVIAGLLVFVLLTDPRSCFFVPQVFLWRLALTDLCGGKGRTSE